MKKSLILLLGLMSASLYSATIDGYWKTIDDVTQQPKGIMQIYTVDGVTAGKVVKGFTVNGKKPKEFCTGCAAPFTDKKIAGLEILWGLHEDDGEWKGGYILDPTGGKIYHVKLVPSDDETSLKVRGYIGVPLIGRTQMWYRLDDEQLKQLLGDDTAS